MVYGGGWGEYPPYGRGPSPHGCGCGPEPGYWPGPGYGPGTRVEGEATAGAGERGPVVFLKMTVYLLGFPGRDEHPGSRCHR